MGHLIIGTYWRVWSVNAEVYFYISELVDQAQRVANDYLPIEAEERVILLDESTESVKTLVGAKVSSEANQSDWLGLPKRKGKEFT